MKNNQQQCLFFEIIMQQDEYKSTYEELASVCYVFEKTLINNYAKCRHSGHLSLAEREGLPAKMLNSH